VVTETEEDSSKKRTSLEEPLWKSLRPRNSLSKTQSEGAKITAQLTQQYESRITRKKADRLSSVSSSVSITSSNSQKYQQQKQLTNPSEKQTASKRYANVDKQQENSDSSPLNSNEFLNVSDYDMDEDEDEISKLEESKKRDKAAGSTTAENVDSKIDGVKADALKALINNTNLASCATYKVKIQLRRPSNNSNFSRQKENTESNSNNSNNLSRYICLKKFASPYFQRCLIRLKYGIVFFRL
jgi:hypothetical protein